MPTRYHAIDPAHLFTTPFDPEAPFATRENSREAYPGVLYPLDLTTVSVPMDRGVRRCVRDVGMWRHDPPGLNCQRVIQGRMYVNISWVLWHAEILPGISAAAMEAHLFGQHVGLEVRRPKVTRAERVVATLMSWRLALGYARAVIGRHRRLASSLQDRAQLDVERLSNQELAARIPVLQRAVEHGSNWNSRSTIFAMTCVNALTRAAGRQLFQLLLPLLSDVGDVESAVPARRMRELAKRALREKPFLGLALVEGTDRWAVLAARAPELKAELDALLQRYGYRSVAEFCLSAPSWADDPTPVMDSFVGLLQAPASDHDQSGAPAADLPALLGDVGIVKRWQLTVLARGARVGAQSREASKAALIVRIDMLRRVMREAGRRMIRAGHLPDMESLYLLTLDEVIAGLHEEGTAGFAASIETRRAIRAALEADPEPPDLIDGLEPVQQAKAAGEGGVGSVMSGMAVSGGIVQGIARVVRSTASLDAFEPDEILVAPYTDAGWTPYFAMASAVIVENGGLMTHTSVIARELGLPAVVNVRDATILIHTGDRLELDANKGEVRILSRAAAPHAAAQG